MPRCRIPTAIGIVLATLLTAPQQVRAQSWPDEHEHGPFHYHADFQLRPFLPLIDSVSQLQTEVPETLGLGRVREPIHVFLFERRSTYRGYLSKFFPNVPHRPALFIKQRGPGMVFAHLGPKVAVDLRHETTHAVLHSVLPMVPLWLDEGLGEYFEMPQQQRDRHPHLTAVRQQVRWRRVPALSKLERLEDIQQMKASHYRDAWSWTHFMLHGPPAATQVLQEYLGQIESRVPPGKLSERLQRALPDLHNDYLDHFRDLRLAHGVQPIKETPR